MRARAPTQRVFTEGTPLSPRHRRTPAQAEAWGRNEGRRQDQVEVVIWLQQHRDRPIDQLIEDIQQGRHRLGSEAPCQTNPAS